LEYDLSAVPALERSQDLRSRSITLAEVMADGGHCSINSTTIRAHNSVAGGKGVFINTILAAQGISSPVSKLHCLADAKRRSLACRLTIDEPQIAGLSDFDLRTPASATVASCWQVI
jgi:hypothetical protein